MASESPLFPERDRLITRIEQFDPVTFIVLLHAIVLVGAGEVARPGVVLVLAAALALSRVTTGALATRSSRFPWLVVRGALSLVLAGAVVAADGGTESPFFFWLLLLVVWQGLVTRRPQLTLLLGVAVGVYLVVVVASADVTAASLARLGLFVMFAFVVLAGRVVVERHQAEARRLEGLLMSVIDQAPMAVALFEEDRASLIYANQAAQELGLDRHEETAGLVTRQEGGEHRLVTLAELVDRAAWEPMPPTRFSSIRRPGRDVRVGFQVRRSADTDPVLLVYGWEESDREAGGVRPPARP